MLYASDKEGTLIKVPIWTGPFLRKIDLSEVSFDNVVFNSLHADFCIAEVMDAEDTSRFIAFIAEDDGDYVYYMNSTELGL